MENKIPVRVRAYADANARNGNGIPDYITALNQTYYDAYNAANNKIVLYKDNSVFIYNKNEDGSISLKIEEMYTKV